MKQSVGLACSSSNLFWRDYQVGDVDRLTALGFAGRLSPLGAEMYRLLICQDQSSFDRALNLLAAALIPPASHAHLKLPRQWREAVAKQTIIEFVQPYCRICCGAGQQVAQNGVLVSCTGCAGHRYHRYSDEERAKNIGIDLGIFRSNFADRCKIAHAIVSGEIVKINKALNIILQ